MKTHFPAKLLTLLLTLFLFTSLTFAQQPETKPVSNEGAEITKETDHLPFMKSEQKSETQEPSTGGMLFKTLGAMFLIVGLIFCGAWALKKLGYGALKSNEAQDLPDLKILSSVSLGSGRTISTVRFGERILLVGSTAQTFTLLSDDESGNSSSSPSRNPRSVAELLSEENLSFEKELETAQNKFSFLGENGGQI